MKDIYERTAKFWDGKPCGSGISEFETGSYDFFEDFDTRYRIFYPYFDEILDINSYKNKRVLIIGLGSGYEMGQFAKVTKHLVGLDISSETIELANKRRVLYNLNYETVCSSATLIPFENESFDLVVSIGCLHHIPDIIDVVKEIQRVLVKGGAIVTTTVLQVFS